jgi:hypothetical protein
MIRPLKNLGIRKTGMRGFSQSDGWRRHLVFWHLWGLPGGGTCKVWVAFLQNASGTHWGPAFASETEAQQWVVQQRAKGPPKRLNTHSPDRDALR